MTRENKLGMVVGFGLLLFVGILVSDHFSAAQRQETSRIARGDSDRSRSAREVSLTPVAAANTESVQTETMSGRPGDARAASLVQTQPTDSAQARATDPVAPIATRNAPAASRKQDSEAGVRLRPIAEGETLFSICKKEYGDGSLSTALAAYNRKAVPDPTRIRKGVTIRLPPIEVLRPGAAGKGTRAQATPAAEPSVTAVETPALAVADVVVAEARTPVGGVVTVDVAPGGVKAGAKPADPKPAKKPSKKPTSRPKVS